MSPAKHVEAPNASSARSRANDPRVLRRATTEVRR